jgi:flagellar hook protein FlgE
VTVYDVKGQPVALTYYFQKTDTDKWNVYLTANGTSLSNSGAAPAQVPRPVASVAFPISGGPPMGSTVTPLVEGAAGSVTVFDSSFANPQTVANGVITLPDIPAVTLAGGGTSEPIPEVTLNLASVFQYGSAFGVTNVQQNGYAPGQLAGLNIEDNGVITARYSNGKTRAAGQLELATFRNPQGLQTLGGNAWAATFSSGEPVRGAPGDGNFGVLQSGALEESNIDLTGELVNMITAQRIYQANAQTIKTQDQILQTLVNIR